MVIVTLMLIDVESEGENWNFLSMADYEAPYAMSICRVLPDPVIYDTMSRVCTCMHVLCCT